MKTEARNNTGIKLLLEQYRKQFRIPENIEYYSPEDYRNAEKKFLKYVLTEGGQQAE